MNITTRDIVIAGVFLIPFLISIGIFQTKVSQIESTLAKNEDYLNKVPILVNELQSLNETLKTVNKINNHTYKGVMYIDGYLRYKDSKYIPIPLDITD